MNPKRHPVLTVLLTLLTTAFILPVFPASAAVTYIGTLAGPSVAAMYPSGLEYDDVNDRIVVADTGLDKIQFYTLGGTKLGEFGSHGTGNGQFDSPRDVAVDGAGNIYVADAGNNRVQAFTSAGAFLWANGGTGLCDLCLNTPIGVTWDAVNSVVLIASTGQDLIKAFNGNGTYAWQSPGEGQIVNGENVPLGIDAPRDVSRGPDGRIWLSDYDHHFIKAFDVTAAGGLDDDTGDHAGRQRHRRRPDQLPVQRRLQPGGHAGLRLRHRQQPGRGLGPDDADAHVRPELRGQLSRDAEPVRRSAGRLRLHRHAPPCRGGRGRDRDHGRLLGQRDPDVDRRRSARRADRPRRRLRCRASRRRSAWRPPRTATST